MHWLIFSFSSGLSRPSMQVNFPSVTVWYNEGYDLSEKKHPPILLLVVIVPIEIL